MESLREYDVDLGGLVTTLLLSDSDAARYGARAVLRPSAEVKAVAASANKARQPQANK